MPRWVSRDDCLKITTSEQRMQREHINPLYRGSLLSNLLDPHKSAHFKAELVSEYIILPHLWLVTTDHLFTATVVS
jgi:hypothetical protein